MKKNMKKSLLGVLSTTMIVTPIITAVSCGNESQIYADLKTPTKQNHKIDVVFDLTSVEPSDIKSYILRKTQESNRSILSLQNGFQSKILRIQQSALGSQNKSPDELIHELKQALVDFLYEIGQVEYSESVSYSSKTHLQSTTKTSESITDATTFFSIKQIVAADESNYTQIFQRIMSKISDSLSSSEEGIWKFVQSPEYIAWYKDKVTNPSLSVTNVNLFEATDAFSNVIARLSLQPTRSEIASYLRTIKNYISSQVKYY